MESLIKDKKGVTDSAAFFDEPSPETPGSSSQPHYLQHPSGDREESEKLPDKQENEEGSSEDGSKKQSTPNELKQKDYPMNGERGCFLVVDMIVDEKSDFDYNYLKKIAMRMGFKERYIQRIQVNNKRELEKHLKRVGEAQHTEYNCFFCVLLAYATHDIKCYYDRKNEIKLTLKELVDPFTGKESNSLSGKPKIFLVHAPKKFVTHPNDETDNQRDVNELPNHSDFFIAVVRPSDTNAYVEDPTKRCSWFVKNFGRVINSHLSLEFKEQMAMLYREMMKQFPKSEEEKDGRAQPFYWNRFQLTKPLHFSARSTSKVEN